MVPLPWQQGLVLPVLVVEEKTHVAIVPNCPKSLECCA